VIAVRPDARDPLPWRVLREIVGAPGELRTEELADLLAPARLAPLPAGAYGAAWARLGLTPVLRDPGDLRAYRDRLRASRARVARVVSRLVAQGLVEPRREVVTLSVWGADASAGWGCGAPSRAPRPATTTGPTSSQRAGGPTAIPTMTRGPPKWTPKIRRT